MRKFIVLIIVFLFFSFAGLIFLGDKVFAALDLKTNTNSSINSNNDQKVVSTEQEHRGIWFSYLDWANLINSSSLNNKSVDKAKFEQNVEKICSNLNSIGINNLYLCVRAFGDAFYKSKLVYRSKFLLNLNFDEFDPLNVFLLTAKKHGLKVHGWINPMRVFRNKIESIDFVPDEYKIKQWFAEPSRKNYYAGLDSHKCWVLNPCNPEVLNYLVDVVEELLRNYDLDGIHLDDYFFPSDIKNEKSSNYNYDLEYFEKVKPDLGNIETFRFNGVSNLVSKFHDKCHEIKPNAVFGVAVVGNFNVNKGFFVDLKSWIKEGYVDYLMPEIYYSFENEHMPFDRCVENWNSVINELKDESAKLKFYAGLAVYRIGDDSKSDRGWQNEKVGDILSKQEIFCRNSFKNYSGYCLFDYKSIFNAKADKEQLVSREIENLNKLFS